MNTQLRYFTAIAALCLQALPGALAHGDEPHDAMDSVHVAHSQAGGAGCGMSRPMVMKDMEGFPEFPSYFLHPEHSGLLFAHIGLMMLAWTIILPISVMFSIARSRLTLPSHVLFLALNTIGLFIGMIYDHQTPDLYENNLHHKFGWAVTWIALAWALLGLVTLYTRRRKVEEVQASVHQFSQQTMAEYQLLNRPLDSTRYRWSGDSGQGTERHSDSLCASPRSNSWNSYSPLQSPQKYQQEVDDDEGADEKHSFLRNSAVDRFLSRRADRFAAGRVGRLINVTYVVLERAMIPLAFLALLTGLVTYSGIGRGSHIFNVIAHLIKGGIFFGYGLLTFSRWLGSFSDIGWAWNLKPSPKLVGRRRAGMPSAEFVESFVIFFYGATNVFLEHLGAWGKRWDAMDFEHVSITIMFFGGGLLGMLVESRRVRDLLSSALDLSSQNPDSEAHALQAPESYVHPLNPIPSLVILLLGIMMSNHTQHSLVSGQIHKQWGLLFAGFALARSLTYVTLWLKPPQSHLPSRPPTELLASFCLVSGGAIFMASNKDTINALEEYHLDAMFVFTVMMGLTCLIMAWTMMTIATKGWAVRRQQVVPPTRVPVSTSSPA